MTTSHHLEDHVPLQTVATRPRWRRRMLAVAAAASALLLAGVQPAFAAGSFTWTASFKAQLTSREWEQRSSGSVSITSTMSCKTPGEVYYITLEKKATFGWTEYNPDQAYMCGFTETRTWTGTSKGKYHFVLWVKTQNTGGQTFTGKGTTRYP